MDIIIIGDYNEITQECIASIKRTAIECNIVVQPFTGNYNESLNKGLKGTTSHYIALCNNDLIFHSGWKESALKWLEKYDTVCPIEPSTHSNIIEPIEGFKKIEQFTGWCIFMKRQTLDKIGGRLDMSALFYRSDAVLARQLQKAKCKNALIPNCIVSHKGSTTLNTLDEQTRHKLTVQQIRKVGRVKGFD